ncbi:MAG: hypothetical protein QCI82_01165 [Candidatus Thermoplasmatota archaeon]|nr:hypothetical protein [Candidatus Thermoplasmatota archaeon]
MTPETIQTSSLIDHILDKMFSDLNDKDEFNVVTINKLRELNSTGQLADTKKIISVLKTTSREELETD